MEHPRRFQTFQMLLFQLKIHRISQVGALVGPAIYMGFCWIPQFLPTIQSIINVKTEPLNYPTRIQRFEIAEIEFSLVFSTESNGSKWIERG